MLLGGKGRTEGDHVFCQRVQSESHGRSLFQYILKLFCIVWWKDYLDLPERTLDPGIQELCEPQVVGDPYQADPCLVQVRIDPR